MNRMFLAIVASLVLSASFLIMHVAQPVMAEQNCDKAGLDFNKNGNVKGNGHCLIDNSLGDGKNPEPPRDCTVKEDFHKNGLKDNDGDTNVGCINRGK